MPTSRCSIRGQPRGGRHPRPGPGGVTLFMDDGQQIGLQDCVSHWNMGRRLLDRVRPPDSTDAVSRRARPRRRRHRAAVVSGVAGLHAAQRHIEATHFDRALELFPDDPDVLFFAGSATRCLPASGRSPPCERWTCRRGVTFDVQTEGAELRRAEQLYKRALERNPATDRGQDPAWTACSDGAAGTRKP